MDNPQSGALQCLPNLSQITMIVRSRTLDAGVISDLDTQLYCISHLIRQGTGSTSQPEDWHSTLTFDLSGIDTRLFVTWCRSRPLNPSAGHVLHLLKILKIKNFHTKPEPAHVEDDMFQALPNLFALFPNLKVFHLGPIGVDPLRKHVMDFRYWQRLHERHPVLEVVKFGDDIEVKMLDLVKGNASI